MMYQYRHIRPINEFRNQMEIPFDGKHPIKDKPYHVHLMDAIKQMDLEAPFDTDEFHSDQNPQELFEAYYDEAFELYLDYNEDYDERQSALDKIIEEEDDVYWSEPIDEIDPEDLESYLTTEGTLKFHEYMKEFMDSNILEHNFMDNMLHNKEGDGLIDIWRAIVTGPISDNDLYREIMEFYGGFGNYWSWTESGAFPHGSSTLKNENGFIIHAKVRPQNINWAQTIYKNAWTLRYEKEIETDPESPILIKGVTFLSKGKEIKLSEEEYMAKT